jgi:hypothetical protein
MVVSERVHPRHIRDEEEDCEEKRDSHTGFLALMRSGTALALCPGLGRGLEDALANKIDDNAPVSSDELIMTIRRLISACLCRLLDGFRDTHFRQNITPAAFAGGLAFLVCRPASGEAGSGRHHLGGFGHHPISSLRSRSSHRGGWATQAKGASYDAPKCLHPPWDPLWTDLR